MKKAVFYILIHLRINSSLKIGLILNIFSAFWERDDSPVCSVLYGLSHKLKSATQLLAELIDPEH